MINVKELLELEIARKIVTKIAKEILVLEEILLQSIVP